MNSPLPQLTQVWKAIEVYLGRAYTGPLPNAIRGRLDTLRAVPPDEFFQSSALERESPVDSAHYRIRLGNPFYPHMKLSMDRRPDRQGYLFRVDTHDRHCCPAPGSPEHNEFLQLMERNQKLAEQIEADWEGAGLPTFKTFLKEDLQRRIAASHG